MRTMIKCFFGILLFNTIIVTVPGQATLVHITLEEIKVAEGKLELQLIRTWGGEHEEDEQKFFEYPNEMVVGNEKQLFICDFSNHCIKVFDESGTYLQTIGRRGRGPGDLFAPKNIAFHPKSGLWVNEAFGRRIQCFDINGKSKAIFKTKESISWMGVNSKNEIAFHSNEISFKSKRLLTVRSEKWEIKREVGVYHDKSSSPLTSERVLFSIDSQDNFVAVNGRTPLIRRYSYSGKLLNAITFETPFESPFKIILNDQRDEIIRIGEFDEESSVKIKNTGTSISIQGRSGKAHRGRFICSEIATDSQNRIYILFPRRVLTEKERKGGRILANNERIVRSEMNWAVLENKDINRLLVFSPGGKIIAQAKLPIFCQGLYIHDDRLFVIDSIYNQQIQEYKMIFKQ